MAREREGWRAAGCRFPTGRRGQPIKALAGPRGTGTPGSVTRQKEHYPKMKPARSLLEVVIAVVALGVLAAVSIPRLSQAAPADAEAELRAALTVLRTAIELYHEDHGAYPGQRSAGFRGAEAGTAAAFLRQLTQYTDAAGRASPTPGPDFPFGPYLRDGVPLCPVAVAGPSARVRVIRGRQQPACDGSTAGWIYNCDTGYVAANSDAVDSRGMRYDAY